MEVLVWREPQPVQSGAGDAAKFASDSGGLEELRMHIRRAVPALPRALDLAAGDGAPKRLPAEPSRVELVGRGEPVEFADCVRQGVHPSRMPSGSKLQNRSQNSVDADLVASPVEEQTGIPNEGIYGCCP